MRWRAGFARRSRAAAAPSLSRIPGYGLVPDECIVTVENGAEVGETEVKHLGTENCAPAVGRSEQIYAQDTHAQNSALWTNFTANWIVPELPASADGQVDYHWPGYKSQQPEMGYPVLQPVLQYGQSYPARWQVRRA